MKTQLLVVIAMAWAGGALADEAEPVSTAASVTASAPAPTPALPKKVSGHIGLVVPMATASTNAPVSTIGSGLVVGVSSGLGLSIVGSLGFDVELVALIDTRHQAVNIVFHPGLLYGLPWGLTVGARGAWETSGAYGVTPLINKGFQVGANALYVEAAFPVRFHAGADAVATSVTAVVHLGVGF